MYEVVIKWYGREEEGLVYDNEAEAMREYNNYCENASTLGLDYLLYLVNNNVVFEWHWYDEDLEEQRNYSSF